MSMKFLILNQSFNSFLKDVDIYNEISETSLYIEELRLLKNVYHSFVWEINKILKQFS